MSYSAHSDDNPILESQDDTDVSEEADPPHTSPSVQNNVIPHSPESGVLAEDEPSQTGSQLSSSADSEEEAPPSAEGSLAHEELKPRGNLLIANAQALPEKPPLSPDILPEKPPLSPDILPEKPPLSPDILPDEQTPLFLKPSEAPASYIGRTFWGTFIELPIFIIILGYSFVMITGQNLLMFKLCHVHLNHSEEICHKLADNNSLKEQVQHIATDYTMYQSFIQNIPPIFFAFFLGTWSDRHGRKYPIIFSIVGTLGTAVVSFIIASSDQMPAEYLFIASAFQGVGGGFVTLMLGIFSYVSDVSSLAKRTLFIARADLALAGALAIGMVASGLIVDHWGFLPVYGMSAVISVIAVLYVIFVLEESVPPLPEEPGKRCRLVIDLFDVSNVVASLKTCLRWREDNKRVHILLLTFSQCILLLPYIGESSVLLYYTNKKFNWTQSDLSFYSAGGIVVSVIGLFVLFRFIIRKFHISDLTCGLMGVTGSVLKGIMIGVSWESWVMYAAVCLTCFQPISIPMVRAMLSKSVDVDEQGRIFALIVCFEAIIPLFASTLYTQTYQATRNTVPGSVFLMSAALGLIPLLVLTFLFVDNKRRSSKKGYLTIGDHSTNA